MKLFTYAAGTTNKLSTYTDSTGNTANANPIVLDSAGRTPNGLWLTDGSSYKFVLAPANDTDPPTSPIWTEDNIGSNDATLAALAASTGSSLVGFIRADAGATASTLQAEIRSLAVNAVTQFGLSTAGTGAANATALTNAFATGRDVFIPDGTYTIALNTVNLPSNQALIMEKNAIFTHAAATAGTHYLLRVQDKSNVRIFGGKLLGLRASDTGVVIGLRIEGSDHVAVEGMHADDFSLDAFYVGATAASDESTNVTFHGCRANNNKRQGLSGVGWKGGLIKGCRFTNTNGSAPECGIDIEPNSPNVCQDIRIEANECSGNSGTGIQLYGTDSTPLTTAITVIGNACRDNTVDGIRLGSVNNCVVQGNLCVSNTSNGIRLDTVGGAAGTCNENSVTGNVCKENGADGIHVEAATSTEADKNTITGNVCADNTGDGIELLRASYNLVGKNSVTGNDGMGILLNGDETLCNDVIGNSCVANLRGISGSTTSNNNIAGNHCTLNDEHGIRLASTSTNNIVSGNYCFSNSQLTDATYDGIFLDASDDNMVTGNVTRRGAGANKQRYGINISNSTCDNNVVTNNDVKDGGSTAVLNNAGTGTVVRANRGWVTESSGTGSIASGATTAVVTHGLSVTPTVDDISITFGEQGTNDYGRFWVGTITSTQFTLNVSADPGASNLDFGWRAVCL